MRGVIAVVMLCAAQLLSAQIRIIPQAKLLEAEPKAIENSSLRFATDEVSFGTIDEMSGVWQGSAILTNSGSEPITITQVRSTCGCLKAELPKRVLASKESIKVALKYYPRGHAGRVLQRVLLYANGVTEQPSAILRLRGMVTASADRSDDYPYTRGVLRLRQERVVLESEGRQILRIACMNGGSLELHPKVDTLLTSKELRVHFEPQILAPKQEGYMIVELSTSEVKEVAENLKIYLKLPNISPRQGVVDVVVGKKDL
jgi:hypothetical protein